MRFPNCSEALKHLAEEMSVEACHDFRALRQIVTCKAWYEKKQEPFSVETFQKRMTDAWDEVRRACEKHGGMRPQIGFLTPEVSRSLPDEAYASQVTAVKEIRKNGLHMGVMVEAADGTVTVCVDDRCEVAKRGEPVENLKVMLKIYGFDVED